MEEGGERWSKPHVSTLSLHSLFELRTCLQTGTVLLDLDGYSLPQIIGRSPRRLFPRVLNLLGMDLNSFVRSTNQTRPGTRKGRSWEPSAASGNGCVEVLGGRGITAGGCWRRCHREADRGRAAQGADFGGFWGFSGGHHGRALQRMSSRSRSRTGC